MIEESPRNVLRAEATSLRLPLFGLAVKGLALLDGFEYRHRKRKPGGSGKESLDFIIRTERDGGSPYPGPLSRRLHMALLHLVSEQGFPFENPVCWTWRDLCRRMELPNSGRRIGEFKAALRSTWGLKIFGLSEIDGRVDDIPWRRLYVDCLFVNEPAVDVAKAESSVANRLWLAPWYLESLNALHSAPVDYDLWKRLEKVGPLASRLYEFLLPTFYKRESVELGYDRLAGAMPVVAESRKSHAFRQFAPALEVLKAEKVLERAAWETMKSTGRPKLSLSRGALLDPSRARERSREIAVNPSEVEPSKNDPETILAEVVERFAVDFYRMLGRPCTPYKSDLAIAQGLIARFGLERAFAILPVAVKRLKVRFRNAETLGALVRYFEEAVTEDDRRLEETKRTQREAAQRAGERFREIEEDRRRRQAWLDLPESTRSTIREAVLKEHPSFRRHPALIEVACIQKLAGESDPSQARLPGG